MSALVILLVVAAALVAGGRYYARILSRVLGEAADRPTPAVTVNDGRDFVPTRTPVVFAHHFASIAGAGPIVGPVLALLYGWGAALIWIVLGGIFIGAVHDYVSTYVSLREGSTSIAVVARRVLGPVTFGLLTVLLVALLALVCAAFLDLSATALTSQVPLSVLGIEPGHSMFREVTATNAITGKAEPHAVIGGIASTSVVVITACSPLLGFLYLRRKWPVWLCSAIAIGICAVSITIGLYLPMRVSPDTWKLLISAYVLIAAGLPVWLFLQSRDFINVHILYVGIAFLVVAVAAAALRGGGNFIHNGSVPFTNVAEASGELGFIWPGMFIIIACGAVSGFHSLCASGTTCKQLTTERAARHVGYYGMLLESFLAACVVLCCAIGLSLAAYKGYLYPALLPGAAPGVKGNAVLTFAMAVGQTAHIGLGLPAAYGALGAMLLLEGFLVTTLDTAIRLTRYLLEEGWATMFAGYDVFAAKITHLQPATEDAPGRGVAATGDQLAPPDAVIPVGAGGLPAPFDPPAPKPTSGVLRGVFRLMGHYWFNSGLAVMLMLLLGLGGGYKLLWGIFGASNQLLAALALLVGSAWLFERGSKIRYTAIPAAAMFVTTITMMIRLLMKYLADPTRFMPLLITDIVILVITFSVLIIAALKVFGGRSAPVPAQAGGA